MTSLLAPARGAHASTTNAATPTATVYLPNITRMLGGPTGWQTPFIVQNIGTASTDLEISFYGFADGALVAQRKVAGLRPGTSYALVPNNEADLPANAQFSVVIRSFGSNVVAVVNEHAGAGSRAEALSYVGIGAGSTKVSLPYVAKEANGWLTTFIIQNVGTAATVATASFIGFDGKATASLTRRIEPGRSAFVDPRQETALQAGSEYAVTVTADQPIGAVVNAHNDASTIVAPRAFSYNGVAPTAATKTYYPNVVKNADSGRSTRAVIQNTGATTAAPQILLSPTGGDIAILISGDTLPAGASETVDMSIFPQGEYGMVVAGGSFAVLGITTNATTATGSTGSDGSSKRLFLPNATRTLGGTNGWTTPVVIESAGATSATLSWYRFSDGTLVSKQMLAGLSIGHSVRVDPRSLAFLSDNSQYSVVIDASDGTVSAIVLEYSDAGGDGAMAYEAFPDPAGAPLVTQPTPSATPSAPSAQPTPTPRPSPTAAISYDPSAYWKPIPGYRYGDVSPALATRMREVFQKYFGSLLLDGSLRNIYQGGSLVGIGMVFTMNPDDLSQPGARDAIMAGLSGSDPTIQLAGQTVVYKDTNPDLKTMIWLQGNYLVVLYGPGRAYMDPLATALIAANR